MVVLLLPWRSISTSRVPGARVTTNKWTSGNSYGGLTLFLRLVGGSRVPNGQGPLRGQSTKREQGDIGIWWNTKSMEQIYGSLHNFQGSKSNVYGSTLASMRLRIASIEVSGRFLFHLYLPSHLLSSPSFSLSTLAVPQIRGH